MTPESIARLRAGIRDVPDFPKPGILFKDITPVLADPELWDIAISALIETAGDRQIDKVVGIDARGFIFGAAVADRLKAGFVPIRKKGKLPYKTFERAYALEYGEEVVQVHQDAIAKGENVLLVDDLLATGGTAAAAAELIGHVRGNLIGFAFLIELTFLKGRDNLPPSVPLHAILDY
ncbi:MAG: adenine phosphoribosyltransferase [Verrucomicrobia bacterium]|nr:adenine phosphoribosyltransferase [Verrucomicrobiota bacterium]